jgi:hypothetical protein
MRGERRAISKASDDDKGELDGFPNTEAKKESV